MYIRFIKLTNYNIKIINIFYFNYKMNSFSLGIKFIAHTPRVIFNIYLI